MPEHLYIFNSKKRKLKLLIFVCLILYSLNFLDKFYVQISKKNKINLYNQLRFSEFYESENLDLVFLGSSHSYCTFDPKIFDEILAINSYQLGMPLQHIDASYYTLLEVLNYHNPKNVVLEIYWDLLKNDFDFKQAETLFEVLKNDDLKSNYMKDVFPTSEKIKYFFNIIKHQADTLSYYNQILTSYTENFLQIESNTNNTDFIEYYSSKGYIYSNYILEKDEYGITNQFNNYDTKNFKISDSQKKYLKKIVDLCNSKNINLIFVTAPIANVSLEKINSYDKIYNYLKSMSNDFGVAYIDYNILNIENNMLINSDFRDDAHLNHYGATIVSKHFAKYLKNNFL